jgi:hypothetical protein
MRLGRIDDREVMKVETLAKRRQRTIRRVKEQLRKFLADRGKNQIENITDYYDWIELPKEV